VKEEEKNRSVEKQIKNGREEKKNPRNVLDRNGLKSTACVFFLVCRSPSVQKGRGEEAVYRPPVFAAARGGDAPPLFRCPEDVPSTVPAIPEDIPRNSWSFGVYFCNF